MIEQRLDPLYLNYDCSDPQNSMEDSHLLKDDFLPSIAAILLLEEKQPERAIPPIQMLLPKEK